MPYYRDISVINSDPVAVTSFLRKLGRKRFNERIKDCFGGYPKFSQLYFKLDGDQCWLLRKGEYVDELLFSLELDEIPLFGWQVFGKMERVRKIK